MNRNKIEQGLIRIFGHGDTSKGSSPKLGSEQSSETTKAEWRRDVRGLRDSIQLLKDMDMRFRWDRLVGSKHAVDEAYGSNLVWVEEEERKFVRWDWHSPEDELKKGEIEIVEGGGFRYTARNFEGSGPRIIIRAIDSESGEVLSSLYVTQEGDNLKDSGSFVEVGSEDAEVLVPPED